jgi:glucans biosynthesis protein
MVVLWAAMAEYAGSVHQTTARIRDPVILGAGLLLLALVSFATRQPVAAADFDFQSVVTKAESLAAEPYAPPALIPEFLRELSYDRAREIRFIPEHSLWRPSRSRFQVMMMAPARGLNHAVRIHEINRDGVIDVTFRKQYIDWGDPEIEKMVPADLGYAGFKLTYPLNREDVHDQFLVFSGASYYRGVGKGEVFGLSARGLAVDTGRRSGEEFPQFVEFWLERPSPQAKVMRLYALLDSKRVTGAYRFVVHPGEATWLEVEAVLFTRAQIGLIGLAPLTSMFFYGENTPRPLGSWRPEVHDTDGLLVHNGTGEWLWRPLTNPRSLEVHSFQVDDARGFGLLQRDMRFESYQDWEARYHRRPSAWVELNRPTGPGSVVLIEIPTDDETNDNVVAFWSPREAVPAGSRLEFAYRLSFGPPEVSETESGRTINSFVGRGDVIGGGNVKGAYRVVVDFAGGSLDGLPDDAPVLGDVTALNGGTVLSYYVERIGYDGRWRLSFLLEPGKNHPAAARAYLKLGDDALTETWTFHLSPNNSFTPGD